jgi:hypothetical protein
MYFLRRRHGRKPPEARRHTPEPQPAQPEAPARYEAPEAEHEPVAPAQPKVITKTRRQRTAQPGEEDCKPAGTFRAGTLHLDRPADSHARHGKM